MKLALEMYPSYPLKPVSSVMKDEKKSYNEKGKEHNLNRNTEIHCVQAKTKINKQIKES